MDINSEQAPNTPPIKIIIQPNSFLVASVFCATLAWMCSCFVLSSVFFGSLSIIFALLSKGPMQKTSRQARASIIGSAAAMVLSTVITVYSVYSVVSNPVMYADFKKQYEAMTGISIDEELDSLRNLFQFQ